jgi:hypothetical protein
MVLTRLRTLACLFAVLLGFSTPSPAFDTPLSDTAVREAYFLGQHRDQIMGRFLEKYTKHLPAPMAGPYVSTITFLTPFAQVVQSSSQHPNGYSAQQAELDHRGQAESVKVVIEIQFTDSYGPYIPRPTGRTADSPVGLVPRPLDFWKNFQVQLFEVDKLLRPFSSSGQPKLSCNDYGGCLLVQPLNSSSLPKTSQRTPLPFRSIHRKVIKSSLISIWLPFAELRYSARLRLITYPSFSSQAKISVRSN